MARPVAARSKAWVCDRSLAGVVGLNLAGGMDVFILMNFVCSVGRSLCDWSNPHTEKLPRMYMSLSAIKCKINPPHPQ
jgi:hypothetical protein